MATGGSYEVDKKTGKKILKERTQDDHATPPSPTLSKGGKGELNKGDKS